MATSRNITQSTDSHTLFDVLERVLDKGVVITGDIKIKLVDVELLTIQLRLLIASVDKAREMGIAWWENNPDYLSNGTDIKKLQSRVTELEAQLAEARALPVSK
ncbi:MAG: gas vesicle protein [Verrucomicrobia bacterium]|nr:gas vesicle protein [Verrucomicrobiota bacterium]